MVYSSNKRHRIKLVEWRVIDDTLQWLEGEKCDILGIGSAGLNAYIFYRETFESKLELKDTTATQKDLEALYGLYPKKVGKKAGLKKLAQIIKSDEDYNRVQAAILNFSRYVENRDKQYIPHFSSFLNKYLDDFLPENYEEDNDKRYGFLDGQ